VKTISIKKRLALGTVVAVAAGLLTTVSATTANAAGTGTLWSYTGTSIKWFSNDANGVASVAANDVVGSTGVISGAFTAETSSVAGSGALLASGRLGLSVITPAALVRDTIVITGGQVIGSANGSHGTLTVSTDGTKVDVLADATGGGTSNGLLIAPTVAAGGTITIQRYAGVASQYAGSATRTFNAAVSVVAASVAGTISTAKSYAYLDAYPTPASNAYDEASGFTIPNGGTQTIRFGAFDAFSVGATGGYLTYSSDNCYVGLTSYSTSKSGIDTSVAPTSSYGAGTLYVSQAVANTATTCAVTISYAGTVIGTKTIKFLGDIATITATAAGIAGLSAADAATNKAAPVLSVIAKDAAGNVVPFLASPTIDSGANAYVTGGLDYKPNGSKPVGYYTGTNLVAALSGGGYAGSWLCGGSTVGAGSASLVFKTTNAAGATIKSAPMTAACGASPYTYTFKMDKDSYSTGEIATITITFKDSKGGVPNDVYAFGAVDKNVVTSGAFASLVTAPAVTDTSTNGVLTYKAIIGQTAGTFPVVVSVPDVNAAGGTDQTATIKVTAAAAAANPDITALVNVVGTLLTSFTKQISALIKALSKKK